MHNILIVLFSQQVTSFENPSSEKQSTSFLSRFISKRKDKVMSWLLVSTKVIFFICRIDRMKSELVYLASLLGFPVRLVESQKAAAFLNVFSYRQFFELRYNPKVLPKLLSPVFSFSKQNCLMQNYPKLSLDLRVYKNMIYSLFYNDISFLAGTLPSWGW